MRDSEQKKTSPRGVRYCDGGDGAPRLFHTRLDIRVDRGRKWVCSARGFKLGRRAGFVSTYAHGLIRSG